MVIYTIATIAFYLLGAGILHKRGLVPASQDIPVLSQMYTDAGILALPIFYVGACDAYGDHLCGNGGE